MDLLIDLIVTTERWEEGNMKRGRHNQALVGMEFDFEISKR